MTLPAKKWFCCCCVVGMFCASASAQDAGRFFWMADGSDPANKTAGTTVIEVTASQQVCLEVFVQSVTGVDFDSAGGDIIVQDRATFDGGGALQADCTTVAFDVTNPFHDTDWEIAGAITSDCGTNGDQDRWGVLFGMGVNILPATVPATGGIYAGEVCYDISADASGEATINWIETLLADAAGEVPVATTASTNLIIRVVPTACCLPGGTCAELGAGECLAQGGEVLPGGAPCLGDGNGNGVDDACEGIIPPGNDCWRTACGETRFDFCENPIPADFFAVGSEPFDGPVSLGGSGEGDFDTSVARLGQIILTGVGSSGAIDIELVELSLTSCEPIVVQTSGQPVEWNVRVGLSSVAPQPGTLRVNKTHQNGGVFTAGFFVQPVFTFSRVDDPDDVRTLDTGVQGIPPALFQTVGSAPWVHQLSAGSTVFVCGQNFAPGVEEDPVTLEQCCRKVGHSGPGHIHETAPPDCSPCPKGACCDPADGSCTVVQTIDNCTGEYKGDGTDCTDTDGDGIPDELETNDCCPSLAGDRCNTGTDPNNPDTDGDGCLDGDEVSAGTDPCDPCDPVGGCPGQFDDCNSNGKPDACDLTDPAFDCNNNGMIDDCSPDVDVLLGACCSNVRACGETTQAACIAAGHDFRGFCRTCPTTGGSVATHDGVVVRHFPGSSAPLNVCVKTLLTSTACIQGGLYDAWQTDPDQDMCHQFGVDRANCPADCQGGECSPPIPADFFGPGSDPFDGSVCLEGVALGGVFGDADTVIERTADPFDRCEIPSAPIERTVEAEVVELNLSSVAPITVTFNGGQNPELWDVAVSLSATPAPPGEVTAIKEHCNGGTYTSVLHILPNFTFTRVGGGGGPFVLDTGAAGICPVTLIQRGVDTEAWVSDLDPGMQVLSPYCTDFHPAVEDFEPQTACDCNANGIRDKCDIEQGPSLDCNSNGAPDECELSGNDCNNNTIPDDCEDDCNRNGIPDDCDIDPTDPDGNGLVSPDCNSDGVPDECEQDCNGNGVADDCDVPMSTGCSGGRCTSGCSSDCNENCIPDECEPDCNGNGQPDGCDIADDPPADGNNNGILDACEVVVCLDDSACIDFDVCTVDRCISNFCSNLPTIYGDVDGNGTINIFDLLCVLAGFAGNFSTCSFVDDDINPCGGNGDINIFDLLAVLGAFAGNPACNCPAGP